MILSFQAVNAVLFQPIKVMVLFLFSLTQPIVISLAHTFPRLAQAACLSRVWHMLHVCLFVWHVFMCLMLSFVACFPASGCMCFPRLTQATLLLLLLLLLLFSSAAWFVGCTWYGKVLHLRPFVATGNQSTHARHL